MCAQRLQKVKICVDKKDKTIGPDGNINPVISENVLSLKVSDVGDRFPFHDNNRLGLVSLSLFI